ncbi:hypothetical protein B0H14DRAFT_2646655 [Mycena olivaceomarginata]|nr:hypothetical protein B0H14DRAFT_2646655 [Mycena olivaceomarginata]
MLIFRIKTLCFQPWSTSQSIEDIIPFTFFNAPNDSATVLGYRLQPAPVPPNDADVLPTPGRPLLTVSPSERGPSRVRPEGNSWPPFYFSPTLPFTGLCLSCGSPRVPRTDPTYLATILDRAVPVFTRFRGFPDRAARVQSGWTAFLPVDEPATSPTWDTYPPLSTIWIFPGTEEFPMDQPLRPLLCRTTPLFCGLLAPTCEYCLSTAYPIFFRAGRLSPTITHIFFNSVRALIASLPPETATPPGWTILPESPDHASQPYSHACTCDSAPSPQDLSSEPYPVMDMSDYDSMWYWWRRLQDEHPSAVQFVTGPSAVGSASFDIRALRGSARKGTPSPRRASAIAASPSHSAEMQVDSPEMSSADALAIAEALDDPPPRRGPPRVATRGQRALGEVVPEIVTPPASEAYNEDGEEEKEDEEEEEEPVCPAKRSTDEFQHPPGQGRAQLLLDSQRDLSVDYRTAVLQYPFISDPRRTSPLLMGTLPPPLLIFLNTAMCRPINRLLHLRKFEMAGEDESASSGSE